MKNNTIIGLSGFAGSGKDLFYKILEQKKPNIVRYSLADSLKLELRDKILKEDDIDVSNCSRKEKNHIRHKLVAHGKQKRTATHGRYWLNKIHNSVVHSDFDICITDIRYDEYDHDEAYWVTEELDGILVHIERYDILNNNKKFLEAPNNEERRNDPKLKAKATYRLQWPSFKGTQEEIEAQAGAHVDVFLVWLDGYNEAIKGQSASVEGQS